MLLDVGKCWEMRRIIEDQLKLHSCNSGAPLGTTSAFLFGVVLLQNNTLQISDEPEIQNFQYRGKKKSVFLHIPS